MDSRYVILKKVLTPGVGLPPPRVNIHLYYNNIQRSSSLKGKFAGNGQMD